MAHTLKQVAPLNHCTNHKCSIYQRWCHTSLWANLPRGVMWVMVPRNRAALVISSCVEKKPSRDLFVSKQALCSLCLYLNPSFSFLLTSPLPFFLYTPRNLWLLLCDVLLSAHLSKKNISSEEPCWSPTPTYHWHQNIWTHTRTLKQERVLTHKHRNRDNSKAPKHIVLTSWHVRCSHREIINTWSLKLATLNSIKVSIKS